MRFETGTPKGNPGGVSIEEVMYQDNRNRVSVMEGIDEMELPAFD